MHDQGRAALKALRYLAIGLGALVAVAVLAAVVLAATVDPEDYKPRIVAMVKDKTGRDLAIDGRLALAFFPRLGVSAGRVALSGPRGKGRFASVEEATVSVAVWPLLRKRVVVDHFSARGLRLDLVTAKGGATNYDDLAGTGAQAPAPAGEGAAFAVDVRGIRLQDAAITWRDERSGRTIRATDVDLRTGPVGAAARGSIELSARIKASTPALDLLMKGAGSYRLDLAQDLVALEDVNLSAAGEAAGRKEGLALEASIPGLRLSPQGASGKASTVRLRLATAAGSVAAKLDLSPPAAEGARVRFEAVRVDAEVRDGEAALAVKAQSPLALDLGKKVAELAALAGELVASGPQLAGGPVKGSVRGTARVGWHPQLDARAELAARLEQSSLEAKLSVAGDKPRRIAFDLNADRLDVDRYLPPPREPKSGGRATAKAANDPIDLAALEGLNAAGSVRVGALTLRGVKATNVHARLEAAGGRLEIAPLGASLYEGSFEGRLGVDAGRSALSGRGSLDSVALGPLLRDAGVTDRIEGRGDVSFDLAASGKTTAELKRSLDGGFRAALRDGAIKGVDLQAIVEVAGAMLGSSRDSDGAAGGETRFSEFSASFAVRDGVAANDDLRVRSPVLEATGRGRIDIAAERMDYVLRVKPAAQVRELAKLRGVAVPVRIHGPADSLAWSIDAGRLAADVAGSRLDKRLGLPEGSLGGLLDALRDKGKKRK